MKTIKKGAKGDQVKVAQYLLGFSEREKATGSFDKGFESHVKAWQEKNKLEADGIIGPLSYAKMAELAPLCTTSKNKKGAEVCAIQILLGGLVIDGIYGTKTKNAVATFQAASNLKVDGKCGSETWTMLITGSVKASSDDKIKIEYSDGNGTVKPVAGKFQQTPDYKQYDSKWGSIMYSCYGNKNQTIKNSGCGPTAMANVVAALEDKKVTPPMLAEFSVAKGHRSISGGTAWSFFDDIADEYGFTKYVKTSSLATAKSCLETGGYVVASMAPGYWTSNGHFITLWKHDGVYMYANDPASSSRKKQKLDKFLKERKQFFCFWG